MDVPGAAPLPEELSTHVASCSRCAREYRERTAYRRLMDSAFQGNDTPELRPGFTARCMRVITARCAEGHRVRGALADLRNVFLRIPTRAAVVSSAALAAVVIAVFVSRGSVGRFIPESADGLRRPPAVMVGVLGTVAEPITLDVQRDQADRRGRELLSRFLQ